MLSLDSIGPIGGSEAVEPEGAVGAPQAARTAPPVAKAEKARNSRRLRSRAVSDMRSVLLIDIYVAVELGSTRLTSGAHARNTKDPGDAATAPPLIRRFWRLTTTSGPWSSRMRYSVCSPRNTPVNTWPRQLFRDAAAGCSDISIFSGRTATVSGLPCAWA